MDTKEENVEATFHPVETDEHAVSETEQEHKLSRLEKLERQKSQIENKIKAIHARENEKVRRERTRRLIQIGAIALKYLNLPDDISPSDFEGLLKRLLELSEVKTILKRS